MATKDFSGINDVIRKASEALAETLSAVNKAVKDLASQAGAGVDRDQMVENWLRAARMSKDGMITALEQGFQWWERQVREQVRRTASEATGAGAEKKSNPMEAWAENWHRALRLRWRRWNVWPLMQQGRLPLATPSWCRLDGRSASGGKEPCSRRPKAAQLWLSLTLRRPVQTKPSPWHGSPISPMRTGRSSP
jgi:hypothetical protein